MRGPGDHGRDLDGVGDRDAHEALAEVGTDRLRQHRAGAAQGDELAQLGEVADLGAGSVGVAAVALWPPRQGEAGEGVDLGEGDRRTRGERVARGEHDHLALGDQLLGVEAGDRVEGAVQEGDVGAPVAQQALLLAWSAKEHLDGGGARLGVVGVEQLGEQLGRRACLGGQHHAGLTRGGQGGTTYPPLGCCDGVQGGATLLQEHGPGLGEGDLAAGALEEGGAEAAFELADRPREWGLGDAETLGCAAEVELLGDGDEVGQLAGLHGLTIPRAPSDRYLWSIDCSRIGVGRGGRAQHDRGMTPTNDQKVALVTGANKGIGYEIAAGLGALGWSVGVGARDDARREAAVASLRERGVDAFGVPLDVTDDASVTAAAQLVGDQKGRLDVLVNNAGITGSADQTPTTVDLDTVRRAVDVNVYGVIRMTNAFLPLLRTAASPRIVNMSSGVGSLTRQSANDGTTGPISVAYSPSKSFLNAVTVQYAKELADTNILINLACPGFVATDLNGFRGTRTPEQGAAIALHLATLPDDGPTGGYFDDDGVIPW